MVIDEIQKVPKLLDVVHQLIESTSIKFVLTGSSARKLKKGSANLLAGRAFQYDLYPLSHQEIGKTFNLDFVLEWGSLPSVFALTDSDRVEYLTTYARTYFREEILQEQLVRDGQAFKSFLEVAAQMNGKSLNFTKISRDIGADPKTVQSFFQILEDTLVGQMIPAFSESSRKSVKHAPKFYLFDLGIKRAMEGSLPSKIARSTSLYGQAFEQFIILETIRLNSYHRKNFQIFHYQTSAGGEIDLVLKKASRILAIEIKSSDRIDEVEVRNLGRVSESIKPTAVYYVSQDPVRSKIGNVLCLHWRDFFEECLA